MMTYKIKISNIDEARQLVKITEKMNGDVDLSYGSYIVDAKSIIGVISLAGGHELQLCIHGRLTPEVEMKLNKFGRTEALPAAMI